METDNRKSAIDLSQLGGTQEAERKSKVSLNNLITPVKEKKYEIKEEIKEETKVEAEPKRPSLIPVKPKSSKEEDEKEDENEKLVQNTLDMYKLMYEQQRIGAEELKRLVDSQLETITEDVIKSKILEGGIDGSNSPIEDTRLRVLSRNQASTKLRERTSELRYWISRDIARKYDKKIDLINSISPSEVEIIKKVRYTLKEVTYYTDFGEYTYPIDEIYKLGGYLILNTNVLFVNLDLDKILRKTLSTNKNTATRFTKLALLMMEPLLGKTSDGKYLMMSYDNLKLMMSYHKTLQEKEIENSKLGKQSKVTEFDKYVPIDSTSEVNANSIAGREFILTSGPSGIKNFMYSKTYITFPNQLLETTGIEFINDIEVNNPEYSSLLTQPIKLLEPFISFDDLVKIDELKEAISSVMNLKELIVGKTKGLTTHLRNIHSALEDFQTKETLEELYNVDFNYLNEIEIDDLFNLHLMLNYEDYELEKKNKAKKDEFEDEESQEFNKNIEDIEETEKLKSEEFKSSNTKIYFHSLSRDELNKLSKEVRKLWKDMNTFFTHLYTLPLDKVVDLALNINIDSDFKVNVNHYQYLLLELEKFNIPVEPWLIDTNSISRNTIFKDIVLKDFNIVKKHQIESESQLLHRMEEIKHVIKLLKDEIEVYKEMVDKNHTITTYINRQKPKYINNIELKVNTDAVVDIAPLVYKNLFNNVEYHKALDDTLLYQSPIVRYTIRNNYYKMRDIIIHFKKLNVEIENWVDILKIFLPSNMQPKALIRNVPEISQLIAIPSIYNDLVHINKLKKFRSINPNSTWDLVIEGKEASLPPLNDYENTLNEMFREIIKSHLGILVGIDFEGITDYIVRTPNHLWSGIDLVKYIPMPQIVDKYFKITPGTSNLKLSKNLIKDLNYVPPSRLAIQKIFNVCEEVIKGYDKSKLDKIFENILDINEQSLKMTQIGATDFESGIGSIDRNVRDYNLRFTNLYNNVMIQMNKTNTEEPVPFSKDEEKEHDASFEKLKSLIENNPLILNSYKEEFDILEKIKDKTKTRYKLALKKTLKENLDKYYEEVNILEDKEDILSDSMNELLDFLRIVVDSQFDKEQSFKQLQTVITQLDLHYFREMGVMLNFIKTTTDVLPDTFAAAYMQIIIDYLVTLRDKQPELPFDNPKNRLNRASMVIPLVLNVLGLENILALTEESKKEALDKISVEYNSQEKSLERKKEEMEAYTMLAGQLKDVPEEMYSSIVINFPKKDLLPDDYYEALAYPYQTNFMRIYPDFYNDDLSIAENIKIRQTLGLDIHPDHLEDERLMDIVDRLILNEDILEDYRNRIRK